MTGPVLVIDEADPRSADAMMLLERHLAFTRDHSPPGACYAFDADELAVPEVTFWIARLSGRPVGCAALLRRDAAFAELKSLHVLEGMRGAGVGRALVETAIRTAAEAGCTRMGLETGWSDGFAPSRRLYERAGFQHGPAFPPYREDTFSYCMTRAL